ARRTLVGIAVTLLLAIAAGWFAFDATQQRQRAETSASLAEKNAALAEKNAADAKSAAADAIRQRDATLLTQSRYLAGFSHENRRKGEIGKAVALARRALPLNLTKPDRPLALEAMEALYAAYASKDHGLRALKGHTDWVLGALQLADGRLLTWSV